MRDQRSSLRWSDVTVGQPTVIERVCAGAARPGCGRTYGRLLGAGQGGGVLVSHGICPECLLIERACAQEGKSVRHGHSESDHHPASTDVHGLVPVDRRDHVERTVEDVLRVQPVDVGPAEEPATAPNVGVRGALYTGQIIGAVVLFGLACFVVETIRR